MFDWFVRWRVGRMLRQGLKRLTAEKPRQALKLIRKAHALHPSHETRYAMALADMSIAEYPEAEQFLRELPSEVFVDPTTSLVMGECLLRQRKWDELEAWIRDLQEKSPQRAELQAWLDLAADPVRRERYVISREYSVQAQREVDAKHYPEALKLLQDALQLTPEQAELHNNIGSVMLLMKAPAKDAYPHFEQAVRLEPTNRRYQQNLTHVRWKR